ncbi:hypothetical protein J6590_038032 [Homalodisca vitripennis]|nr:hypothetical protein J6590_038032 [Homalodisca vitripennis]
MVILIRVALCSTSLSHRDSTRQARAAQLTSIRYPAVDYPIFMSNAVRRHDQTAGSGEQTAVIIDANFSHRCPTRRFDRIFVFVELREVQRPL